MKKLMILLALVVMAGAAFGQTLEKGGVIGAYPLTITLDPDVTMNQFLDYLQTKSIPAWEENFEGVKLFVLKGYRGVHSKGYGLIIYCESTEVYDRYWDDKGELTELGQEIMDTKLKAVNEEGMKLGRVSWDFTDWVIL